MVHSVRLATKHLSAYGLYFQDEHDRAQVTSLIQRQGKLVFCQLFQEIRHFTDVIKKQIIIVLSN